MTVHTMGMNHLKIVGLNYSNLCLCHTLSEYFIIHRERETQVILY